MTNKKLPALAASFALAAALFASAPAFAHEGHDHAKDADSAKSAYPLTTCVVSGDKLEANDMGGPVDYIYKQAGQPDRLVRFCCKDCIKDFEKEPAKFLKKLDDAAATKAHSAPKQ